MQKLTMETFGQRVCKGVQWCGRSKYTEWNVDDNSSNIKKTPRKSSTQLFEVPRSGR